MEALDKRLENELRQRKTPWYRKPSLKELAWGLFLLLVVLVLLILLGREIFIFSPAMAMVVGIKEISYKNLEKIEIELNELRRTLRDNNVEAGSTYDFLLDSIDNKMDQYLVDFKREHLRVIRGRLETLANLTAQNDLKWESSDCLNWITQCLEAK